MEQRRQVRWAIISTAPWLQLPQPVRQHRRAARAPRSRPQTAQVRRTMLPRLTRCALGNSSFTSLANWTSLQARGAAAAGTHELTQSRDLGTALQASQAPSWLASTLPLAASALPPPAHREDGSRLVVMRILGSRSPACAYSSSMWVRGTAVLSSSSSTCRAVGCGVVLVRAVFSKLSQRHLTVACCLGRSSASCRNGT